MEFAEIYLDLQYGGARIEGSSQVESYKNHIELFDWSWGIVLGDVSPTAQSSERQAQGNMVSIKKPLDKATTAMLKLLQNGETCTSGTLLMVQQGERPVEMKIMLRNVRVMSYDLDVETADREVELTEKWMLGYDKVEISYKGGSTAGVRGFTMDCPPGVKQDAPATLTPPNNESEEGGEGFVKSQVKQINARTRDDKSKRG